jgi:hypothetical protein
MQIIVSPLEGENFLLDVAPDAPTEVLRLTVRHVADRPVVRCRLFSTN